MPAHSYFRNISLDAMIIQELKLDLSLLLTHSLKCAFAVEKCLPDRCETRDWALFAFLSPREKAFTCVSSQMRVCSEECVLRLSVQLCFTQDCCNTKVKAHLRRSCWFSAVTAPCVIFILNTKYSLPNSALWCLCILCFPFFSASVSLFFFHTHTLTCRLKFPCLVF